MKGLILDDVRNNHDCFYATGKVIYEYIEWDIVKTYDDFIKYMSTQPLPDVISFDHDLCDEHYKIGADYNWNGFNYNICKIPTGLQALKWTLNLFKETGQNCEILIHSHNPYGSKMMYKELYNFYTNDRAGFDKDNR